MQFGFIKMEFLNAWFLLGDETVIENCDLL